MPRGESRTEFAKRVEALIESAGSGNALAMAARVSEGVVRKWKAGESDPSRENLISLARASGVRIEWLATGEGPKTEAEAAEFVRIPLYDIEVSAGPGEIPVDESIREYIPLKISWLKAELRTGVTGILAVPVRGDSMHPTIDDGDLVLVERTSEIRDDAIYVFRRGDVLQIKRLQALPGGRFQVISDNPVYKPYMVDPTEHHEYAVIGRVVWHGRNL